jgi:cytochrome P450
MSDTQISSTVMADAPAPRRPPAPVPPDRALNPLEVLYGLWSNPLTTWTRRSFEEPVVLIASGVMGPLAIVSEPTAIRQVMVENAANYRKDDLQLRVLRPGLGNGLLTAEGDEWRLQRRALAPLFTPRVVAGFLPAMQASADWIVARWVPLRPGRRIDVASEMSQLTLDVLSRTIFPQGLGRDPQDFARAMSAYFDAIGRLHPLDVIGAPKWVPRVGRPRATQSMRFFESAVDDLVAARRAWLAEGRDGDAQGLDLLTRLLAARDPQTGAGLGEYEIRANILTFIGAGHETTANALTWSLYLLSQHPAWRASVEAEVDAAPFPLSAEALDALPRVRASLEEAMRLYPPAPSLSRAAIAPDVLAGRRIAAGTTVVISPYVVHRHRRLWPHPNFYDPARFLPGRREAIDRFAYLPFGAGPRVCIGMGFAMQEATILLATIVHHFRLEPAPGHQVEPIQRITLRPKGGMPMLLTRRG